MKSCLLKISAIRSCMEPLAEEQQPKGHSRSNKHSQRKPHLAIPDGYVHVHDDALDLGPGPRLPLDTQWWLQLLNQAAQLDGWDEVAGVRVQLRPDLQAHMGQPGQFMFAKPSAYHTGRNNASVSSCCRHKLLAPKLMPAHAAANPMADCAMHLSYVQQPLPNLKLPRSHVRHCCCMHPTYPCKVVNAGLADWQVVALTAAGKVVNDDTDDKVDQHQATQQHKAAEVDDSAHRAGAAAVGNCLARQP